MTTEPIIGGERRRALAALEFTDQQRSPECHACGACCHWAAVPPFEDDELCGLAPELREPIERHRRHELNPRTSLHEQGGSLVCSWFDRPSGRCRHYDIRPRACRDFARGGEACQGARRMTAVTVNGKGDQFV